MTIVVQLVKNFHLFCGNNWIQKGTSLDFNPESATFIVHANTLSVFDNSASITLPSICKFLM